MTKIQKSKHGLALKRFWSLDIGICELFVIWCLEFVMFYTLFQGKAVISISKRAIQTWAKNQLFNEKTPPPEGRGWGYRIYHLGKG
jgi:hypothetical protein